MLLPVDKGGTGPKRFRVATLQKCFSDHTELSANRGEIQRSKVWGKTRTSWVTGKTAIKYPCCSSLIVMVVMMCMSCGMVVRITVTCYLVKICPHQWEFLLLRNISYSSVHCQKRVILHCSYFVILIFILRGLCAFTIESMSLQRHFNLVSNCAVGESWWDKDSTLVYMPQILFLFLRKPFTCLDLLKNFRWLFFWQLI